ncbi:MAG: hypothetical protein IT555_09675 [Acetobacteraceae bacterium]|nr:hypothetical protein [Acetobacteraceae bacterium]
MSEDPRQINLLLRGQSNLELLAEDQRGVAVKALQAELVRLLGFDPATDCVSIVYDRYGQDGATTAIAGTAFLRDWIEPINGDWTQGWQIDYGSRQLLQQIALTIANDDVPTAVVWLHNETDSGWNSTGPQVTAEMWESGVRWEAAQIRAAAGRSADEMPYIFVSAIPYWGRPEHNQQIRTAMETLAADPEFAALIGARAVDVNMNWSPADAFGGPHIAWQDGVLIATRLAASIAEAFAYLAKPGSPVALAGGAIANAGPRVISAALVEDQPARVLVRLAHDGTGSLEPLSDVAALGAGWSLWAPDGRSIAATAATILDADLIALDFAAAVPAGGRLYFGWGNARTAIGNTPGQRNALYDTAGFPVWTEAVGVAVGAPGSLVASLLPAALPVAPSNRPPDMIRLTAGAIVAEDAAAGVLIGHLLVADPDAGDTVVLQLVDDAGGRVLLDPTTGALRVAPGGRFDFETEPQIALAVEAKDRADARLIERIVLPVGDVYEGRPNLPAKLILSAGGAFDKRTDHLFDVPVFDLVENGAVSRIWRGAEMFVPAISADATVEVVIGQNLMRAELTPGCGSVNAIRVWDDAPMIEVSGFVETAVTSRATQGGQITLSHTKRGVVQGSGGGDTIIVNAWSDLPDRSGGWLNMFVVNGWNGNDVIIGNSHQDWTRFQLNGGAGSDILVGGAGNDVLIGGAGDDLMTSGGGADHFLFAQGDGRQSDVIRDFSAAEGDRIVLQGIAPETVVWQVEAQGVVIRYGADNWLLLEGVELLAAGAILFG